MLFLGFRTQRAKWQPITKPPLSVCLQAVSHKLWNLESWNFERWCIIIAAIKTVTERNWASFFNIILICIFVSFVALSKCFIYLYRLKPSANPDSVDGTKTFLIEKLCPTWKSNQWPFTQQSRLRPLYWRGTNTNFMQPY